MARNGKLVTDTATKQPPASRRRLTLHLRLILLVVAGVLPLLVFSLWRQYLEYQADIASTGRQTLELARSLSLRVEQELRAHIAILQVLALSPALKTGDFDSFRTQAEALAAQQFPGSNILLLRADGQQLMNTAVPLGAPLPVRQHMETLREVFATGRPAVSNLYYGIVVRRPVVSIEVPVKGDDGQVVYSLSVNPPLETFAEVIRRQRSPESWVMSVFDGQGVNVARAIHPEQFIGRKAGAQLLVRLLAEHEGIIDGGTSREGIPVVAAFSHTPSFGWAVAIGVPRVELTAPAFNATMRTLAAGGAMLAISLALALFAARQIAGPIAVLRRLATAADREEILNPPSTGLGEADDVVQALRGAEERRRQSESVVLERTVQLETSNRMLESEIAVRRQAEQKAQAQLERLNLLHQITRAIGERQDLNSIFQVVVRSVEDQLPADFACLCLYEPADRTLTVTSVGLKSAALATELAMTQRAQIDIDENGLSRCLRGQLVYEEDISRSTFSFPQRLSRGGLQSLVVAPLQVESRVFGVLVVAHVQAQGFSSGECEFLRQLSEHAALAAHQAQLYGALQQAYEDLRQTQQAVMQQERLRALGQMASGIAHDINNALTPASLYTEELLDGEVGLSSRGRQYLEIIQRAIDDVTHTVARLNDFYRQREATLALASVHVNRLVRQVVDLTRARWNDIPLQRGVVIQVQTDLAVDPPAITGVENEIRDALTNLVLNAVDALPGGGKLTLTTRTITASPLRYVQIEVADNGAGMDEDTRRRCLEPFFTTKGERGTGLGLAMVYGAVQRHGAEMDITSAPGKGTTVHLTFPVPEAESAKPDQAKTDPAVPQRLRLLVVDDDPLLLKSLRDILEASGHVVVTASDGQAGIDAFRDACERGEIFAAVITDLGMPYVDGRKVASAVKTASPGTPVILLTGWGQRLADDEEVPQYVDRVLSKPPKLGELRAALALLCRPAMS